MESAFAILSSVACPAVRYFSILSHKRQNFRKENIKQEICVFFSLQILPEIFLILRIIKEGMIKNVYRFHVKYTLFLTDYNIN